MSITRRVVSALVAVLSLTVMAPGHAETPTQEGQQVAYNVINDATSKLHSFTEAVTSPIVNPKELACLARNIFFEAGNEPEEGKVAVGLVTLNRVQDGRFANTVCGVVEQKLTRDIPHKQIIEKKTFFKTVREEQTVWSKISICQFSWRCMFVKNPKSQDERWLASQEIAQQLLQDDASYGQWRSKYSDALYFHATGIRPSWARQKHWLGRVGGHFFYSDPAKYSDASFRNNQ